MKVPLILTEFLDRAVRLYGDKEAIYGDTLTLTYNQLNKRVNQLSHGLESIGVQKGDRVAYLAPNTVEMLEGFYGVYQLNAIMVPLNIRLQPNDYVFILNHSESKVLFVDQELYRLIQPIKDQLVTVETIIVHDMDGDTTEIGYDNWLASFPEESFCREEIDEEDVCSLLYTSGTTGDPKGVMLTHRNNYLHALSTMHHLRVSDQDTLIHVLPMFHVNGWGSPFYYTANGAKQLCLRKTTPEVIFQAMEKYKVSIVHMAPTVLNSLMQYYDQYQTKFSHPIRVVIAGSAPPPAFVSKVEAEMGWDFIQVYGMTESSPLSTISQIRSHIQINEKETYRMKAKAGYQMIGSQVKVVDEYGAEVASNSKDIGEVVVRSHGVMKGYWKNEKATAETIRDGWLHTGDMGTVDQYGNIDIVDRKKDIIISGGENISSIEIEGVLYEHPAILEAAVIAVPHEKWGETPHAFIVLKEGMDGVNEKDIIAFTRENMAHFKAITSVTFTNELPKTASGKIQKIHLRNDYWATSGKDGRYVN
ncbi:long-chain-fatty-acid--CoA ligase [Cytobacillus sp. FSL W7-1323]|uniref:AMP-dependent synthetase n=1 Tax=Cytobacillus kochii TaxID=859143 RepID=A0A248TDM8_9BACI|nr:long-chain-fatty-acid--CoA ligase [Cytobacillus kochii]ASV66273.1 AMP-dependent synthetase [Cytobacillus kochii]MDQ0187054.1 fatty-acyl-CoA synthase [Cytobacillus kochii]